METSRRDDESTVSTQEFREGSAEQEEVYSRSVEGKRTTETKREFAERRCEANLLYKWWPPASICSSGSIAPAIRNNKTRDGLPKCKIRRPPAVPWVLLLAPARLLATRTRTYRGVV